MILYIQERRKKKIKDLQGKSRKESKMEEMNTSELLVKVAEENQTRKILEILNESKDLDEAKDKIKALLNK